MNHLSPQYMEKCFDVCVCKSSFTGCWVGLLRQTVTLHKNRLISKDKISREDKLSVKPMIENCFCRFYHFKIYFFSPFFFCSLNKICSTSMAFLPPSNFETLAIPIQPLHISRVKMEVVRFLHDLKALKRTP